MTKFFPWVCVVILGIFAESFVPGVIAAAKITVTNKCDQKVWLGISSNPESISLQPTGLALQKGESKVFHAPSSWGGTFWGRTHCSEDSDGKFKCAAGDCGSGMLECDGAGANPPATLAKFNLAGDGGKDLFEVSLVGGFNLPILVSPSCGSGERCMSTGCTVDINERCPPGLEVDNSDGRRVACKSACVAFGQPEDCCHGAYGTRETCKPSQYSQFFKNACPRAKSYAFDDKSTFFRCKGSNYKIIFCPTSTPSNSSTKQQQHAPTTPQLNTGTVYEGTNVTGNSTTPWQSNIRAVIGLVVAILSLVGLLVGGYAIHTRNCNILNGSCNCC